MDLSKCLNDIGGFNSRFGWITTFIVTVLGSLHSCLALMTEVISLLVPENCYCLDGITDNEFENVPPRGRCMVFGDNNTRWISDVDATCEGRWIRWAPLSSIPVDNQWICGNGSRVYIFHSIYFLGSLFGYICSGFAADRCGRKATTMFLLVISISGALTTLQFSKNLTFLAIGRALSGVAAFSVTTLVILLVLEYTVIEKRTLVNSLWGLAFSVFSPVFIMISYYFVNWRVLPYSSLSCDVLLLLVIGLFMPESASWLLSRGRRKEAIEMFDFIANFNGIKLDRNNFIKKHAAFSESEANDEEKMSFWQQNLSLFRTPRLRLRTIVLNLAFFGIGLGYFGLNLNLDHIGLEEVHIAYSVGILCELPFNFFCIFFLDIFGRRWPNIIFVLLASTFCFIKIFANPTSLIWIAVLGIVPVVAFSAAFSVTMQIGNEVFPTAVRGRAVLLLRVFGDLGGTLCTRIVALEVVDRRLPSAIFGLIGVVTAVLLSFVPDSVGVEVPHSLQDGEDFQKAQNFCFCPIFCYSNKHEEKENTANCDKSNNNLEISRC